MGSPDEHCLEAFEKWFSELPVYRESGNAPARGTIAAALTVLERLKTRFTLNLDDYRTEKGKTQLSKVSTSSLKKILASFGEHRPYLKEGGRTNRGGPGDIFSMLETLKKCGLDALTEERRSEVIVQLQAFLVERVRDFHNKQRVKFEYHASKTTWQLVADILIRSREEGKDAIVAQHLVGAKLALRFPDITVSNHSYSTADNQLQRSGDFHVGDTAFHVTLNPLKGVFERCRENLQQGLRVYLLIPDDKLAGTRMLAQEVAEARIGVEAIESFVSQNIEELSLFNCDKRKQQLRELLEIYNRRVNEVELDKSLLIELPANLL